MILFLLIPNLLSIRHVGEAGYDENKVGKNETEVVMPLKQNRATGGGRAKRPPLSVFLL